MIRSVTIGNKQQPTLKRSRAITPSRRTKASRSTKLSNIPRSLAGIGRAFPEKLSTTHKYVVLVSGTCPAFGTNLRFTFKANGMFDPEDAIGGHQPLYYDSMTPIYNHYVVTKSSMKATILPFNPNAATIESFVAFAGVDDDNTTSTSYQVQGEILPSKQQIAFCGNESKKLTCGWSAAKVFGANPLDNPRLQGTASADPTELSHFALSIMSTSGVAGAVISAYVEITYQAVWFELKTPVLS